MTNAEYWTKRFLAIENEKHLLSVEMYDSVMDAFLQANRDINHKLFDWYLRFADNNEMDLVDAKKLLRGKDLQEFKWSVQEYIKYGKKNAINQLWMKELENVSAKVHISALESIKLELQNALEVFATSQDKIVTEGMKNVYTATMYRSMYEIQLGLKDFTAVQKINDEQLAKIINAPWASDAKTFSQRIWGNKEQMVQELQKQLVQNIITGKAPNESIRNMAKKFDTTKSKAANLIQTESSYFYSQAQKDTFKELDIEKFQFVATLDTHTSEICREMDERIFPMSEYKIGVNAPPLHCRCRSCTVPYFDDQQDVRAYRDKEGRTKVTDKDMNYQDWYKKYVKG